MKNSWFREFEFLHYISCYSEVRVLINTAWNQTCDFSFRVEYMWERCAHCRCSLDRRISYFSTIVTTINSETAFQLVIGHVLLKSSNIGVHSAHIFTIIENESPFFIESYCQYVLDIFIAQFSELLQFYLFIPFLSFLVEILLIIRHHNH